MKLDFSNLSRPTKKLRGQLGTLGMPVFTRLSASPECSQDMGANGDALGMPPLVPSVPPQCSLGLGTRKPNAGAVSPLSPVSPPKNAEDHAGDTMLMSIYPVADGPFMPWCLPMSPERLSGLLADLRTTIGKVADIDGWTDDQRAHLMGLVARQPISTLADDLAYFRKRLSVIEAGVRVAQIGRQARGQ